jgi:GTPase involved in cell partitioning and DNA repair
MGLSRVDGIQVGNAEDNGRHGAEQRVSEEYKDVTLVPLPEAGMGRLVGPVCRAGPRLAELWWLRISKAG